LRSASILTYYTIVPTPVNSYVPKVFILSKGEHLHIPKGALHAFRKLSLDPLPADDCHAQLRKDLIEEQQLTVAPNCVSIAHDWYVEVCAGP